MADPLLRITSIGRPVEPKYRTNLAILIVMAVVLVGAGALAIASGDGVGAALLSGGHAMLLVFMVWAYGRETAPDDNPAAFVAVALAAAGWVYGLRPDVLPLAALMGGTRIVNRTVGPTPKLSDMVIVTGLAAWITWTGNWPVGVAVAMALMLDVRLAPRHAVAIPFAVILVLATVATWWTTPPVFGLPTSAIGWAAIGVGAAYAVVLVTQGPCDACTDVGGEALSPARVQGGMAVALLAALAMAGRGEEHVLAGAGLFAVLAGVALGRPRLWIRRRRSP
ncbi:MAG: hypothetical protein ACE37F_24160 [Nannocystaceae bacterium]|nr:hypothetical protein [bacterium]